MKGFEAITNLEMVSAEPQAYKTTNMTNLLQNIRSYFSRKTCIYASNVGDEITKSHVANRAVKFAPTAVVKGHSATSKIS